jgi:hypothetical protein
MLQAIATYPKLAIAIAFGLVFCPVVTSRLAVAFFSGRFSLAPLYSNAHADIRTNRTKFAYLVLLFLFFDALALLGFFASAEIILT